MNTEREPFDYTKDDAIEDQILCDREEARAVPPCAAIPIACECGGVPSTMGTPVNRGARRWQVRCYEPGCGQRGPERVGIEASINDWNAGEREEQ